MTVLRGVVFDLDDTLTDNSELELEVWGQIAELVAERHPHVDQSQLRARHRESMEGHYSMMLAGHFDEVGYQHARITHALQPWAQPDDELLEGYVRLKRRLAHEVRAAPGALEAVREVRAAGLRTGVLTNGLVELQQIKLGVLGLHDVLDAAAVSEAIGAYKPAPEAFAAAAQMLGCEPSQLAMVGDNAVNDIEGALAAGYAQAIHVHPDAEVKTLGAAVKLLLG